MAKPSNCISETAARTLHDNWVNTRAVYIQQARGSEDTRDFVFSVAELEEFLKYVKDESNKKGINDPGIRIYFAAYNNATSNKATVFLSPTVSGDVNANNNYAIESLNTVGGGFPPNTY